MKYNFDEIIDRRNTNAIKYDFSAIKEMPEDVIPMWVADMDFKSPPAVREAIKNAAEYGIFGYSTSRYDYFDAVHNWFISRFGWDTKYEWLIQTPGVVFALAAAIRALTEPGDSIIIQRPVYYPFSNLIRFNRRNLINSPLIYKNGRYSIDFDDFESKIIENKVKLFLLCSPHNPVCRVWTKEELIRLGNICVKHGVIVVSDEIHCDFVFQYNRHHVFASLNDEFLYNSVICTAPSKTFNLAGLQAANIFIANEEIRKKYKDEMKRTGYSHINLIASAACQAAYKYGADWFEELSSYLEGNISLVKSTLNNEIPEIILSDPQGTYLLWLDFRKYSLSEDELEHLIIDKARIWMSRGSIFGVEGRGFYRMNIGLPRPILEKALKQLIRTFRNI